MMPTLKSDKPKAAGYVRVSTQSQAAEGESLITQRKQIEAYAELKGCELVKVYEDAGISGSRTDNRPGLQALLDSARRNEFTIVIVSDLTRFGRSARDLLNNTKFLKDRGIDFVSLKENIDRENPYGQFMFTVLSAAAELEHEMIYSRMNDNKMARWREKRIINGSLPLGYTWNKQSHAIEVVPEEKAIYLRIVTEYLDLGRSIREIALRLKRDAVPTRLRGEWSSTAICQFLRNPAYYGLITVNTKKLDDKGRVVGDKPASEHIVYQTPPLITKSRWDDLQNRLESARVRSGRPVIGASQFLLYGMLQCGECGGKVVPRWGTKRADGTAPRYYSCHWRSCGKREQELRGREKCALPIIPAEKLEGFMFYRLMVELLGDKEKHYAPALDSGQWDQKIESIQRKVEQLQDALRKNGIALKNIDSCLEDPEFDQDTFKGKRNGITSEIYVLNQQIEEAVSEIEHVRQLREQEDLLRKFATDKQGVLKEVHSKIAWLPNEGKQRLLRGMLAGPVVIKEPFPYSELDGDDAPLFMWVDFSFRFNPEIIKEVLEIGTPDKNRESTHYCNGSHASQGCGPCPSRSAIVGCPFLAPAAFIELL
jgi:DNA invertase Pin-like site-specific DNA recombinase